MQSVEGARRLTTADVKAEAKAAGFDLCGIAPGWQVFPSSDFWASGCPVATPARCITCIGRRIVAPMCVPVMPSAQSVISLGVVYNTDRPYSNQNSDPIRAAIARYAWGDDYHVVIEQRLERLRRAASRDCPMKISTRAHTSTRARCRSVSTRSMPALAGSARIRV